MKNKGISEKEFEWLAGLSKLEFSGEEKAEFMKDFDEIAGFADKIRELESVGEEKSDTGADEKSGVADKVPGGVGQGKVSRGVYPDKVPGGVGTGEETGQAENGKLCSFSELREDSPEPSLPCEEILSDREAADGFFLVNRIIKGQ